MDIAKNTESLFKEMAKHENIELSEENAFDDLLENFKKFIDEETLEKLMPHLLEYCNISENVHFILGMRFIHNLHRRLEN